MAGLKVGVEGKKLCCGAPYLLAGLTRNAREHAVKVLGRIKGKRKIVVNCPLCYKTLKESYRELLGVELPVYHLTQLLLSLIKNGAYKLKPLKIRVTYHDPCELGRGMGVYEEPRLVLGAIPGVELVEMELNREDSTCCGGGGLTAVEYPVLSVKLAVKKIREEVLPLRVDALVTACPLCLENFRSAVELLGVKLEVYDVVEVVYASLMGGGTVEL